MARKKQLITRAGRGTNAKVTVTDAGLKVIENMTAEGPRAGASPSGFKRQQPWGALS